MAESCRDSSGGRAENVDARIEIGLPAGGTPDTLDDRSLQPPADALRVTPPEPPRELESPLPTGAASVSRPARASESRPTRFPRVLALPAVLAAIIAALSLLANQAVLRASFLGAASALAIWCAWVGSSAHRNDRALHLTFVPRAQHWVQACAQAVLILYWAFNNRLILGFLPFIAVQLVFAYAVDSLLTWSRRDEYALGFGPFPIIFSTNLFLLFRPEWFYWQFVLIVLGFVAKDTIRWTRDGRSAHIFNPSSFPLAVFSLVLLVTGTTNVTFGNIIANTIFDTPHIYLAIFLVALPGQLLFGVARVTVSAAITLYLIGLAYFAITGTYLFYDAYIPAAVFIGMTLLVTDPSTSPRTDLGRIMFGALYAAATAVLFVLLERAGAPTFYDKLLPVPLLNLMVRGIDRVARSPGFAALDPGRLLRDWPTPRRNVAYTSVWVAAFLVLLGVQGIGDRHPGQYLPFWHDACGAGSSRACGYVARLTSVYCQRGSGWACNDIGILNRRLGRPADREFARACQLGYDPGCTNARNATAAVVSLASGPPQLRDLPIVLSGTKPTLRDEDPARLYALACEQRWPGACTSGAPR